MSTERFIKYIPSEKTVWLRENHPWAFLLLSLIAERARRTPGHYDGFQVGQALIGDHKAIGATRGQYRHALKILEELKFISVFLKSRNCQNATIKTAIRGTIVTLLNSDIWDINIEDNNHPNNHQATIKQPSNNHEQERIRKNKNEKEENTKLSSEGKKLPSKATIVFSFENRRFENVLAIDLEDWKSAYPGVDVEAELKKMQQWLLANTEKSPKSKHRAFITRWLTKAQNDLSRTPFKGINSIDRRTKNIDGTAVTSPIDGRF